MEVAMHWLREHMVGRAASIDSGNLLAFPDRFAAVSDSTAAALDLVSKAAEAIRAIHSEAPVGSLTEQAIEKLRIAEARIQSAETARRVAEENLQRANARLGDAERELIRTASRIAAAEAELASAEERIKATEVLAPNAERAFKQKEPAIRAQLIGLGKSKSARSANAA
jgi:predicted  nucleic acid-binding Zn-ribbon protein